MAHILAIAVGLGSFALYMAAFFLPEVHRKYDFVWSGVAMFYALVLWVCDGRITGGVLLGQAASVALLGWLGWQTLQMRRQLTPALQQTPLPDSSRSFSQVTQDVIENVKRLRLRPTPSPRVSASNAPVPPSPQPQPIKTRKRTQANPGAIAPPAAPQDDSNDSLFDEPQEATGEGAGIDTAPAETPSSHSGPAATTTEAGSDAAIASPPVPEANPSDPDLSQRRPVEDIPTATLLEDEPQSPFEDASEDENPANPDTTPVADPSDSESADGEDGDRNGAAPDRSGHATPVGTANGGLPRGAIASESLALRKPLVIRAEIIGFDDATTAHTSETEAEAEEWGHPPEPSAPPNAGDDEEWF